MGTQLFGNLTVEANLARARSVVVGLIKAVQDEIGQNVLIFGASNVALVSELLSYGKKVTLIDIRETAFEKFAQFEEATCKLVVEHDEFESLDQQFDTIIFFDTLHHVSDKKNLFERAREIMSPEATIVAYEPNWMTRVMRELDQFGELKESVWKRTLMNMLRDEKFTVAQHSSELLIPQPRRLSPIIARLQMLEFDPVFRIMLTARRISPEGA